MGGLVGGWFEGMVAGNMSEAKGACLFGMVIWLRFLELFDFLDFLELMEDVEALVWWRWPEV